MSLKTKNSLGDFKILRNEVVEGVEVFYNNDGFLNVRLETPNDFLYIIENRDVIEDEDEVHEEEQASREAVRINVLPSLNPPSRQEALERYCTQIPFRSWCPHCVRGTSKSSHHRASGDMGKSETAELKALA